MRVLHRAVLTSAVALRAGSLLPWDSRSTIASPAPISRLRGGGAITLPLATLATLWPGCRFSADARGSRRGDRRVTEPPSRSTEPCRRRLGGRIRSSADWRGGSRPPGRSNRGRRCAARGRTSCGPQRWQNARVSTSALGATRARIVTAFLRDGNRVLLCHRSPQRRGYPDVWDLPGGHVEPGELPGAALARELREELGIDVAVPAGPPMQQIHGDGFEMQIWLIERWTGTPVNVALDEHDAIAWFQGDELGELRLAHDSFLRCSPTHSPWGELDDHPRAL